MNPAVPTTARGIKRLACLAMLVLVLRFVGAELHHVLDAHAPGESCAACLVLERGGNALPEAGLAALSPTPAEIDATLSPVPPAAAPALTPLPRGPPLLSS
jgi:hypothetical protein